MKHSMTRAILASIAVTAAINCNAQTLDTDTVDALERFYHHFNGDDWTVRTGWLDEHTPACQWHGVRCSDYDGDDIGVLNALDLHDNNLSGRWDESDIADWVDDVINLSGNAVSGRFSRVPCELQSLDLSDNELSGPLPEKDNAFPCELSSLSLARNEIEGPVPASWRGFEINIIDLSGNRLYGNVSNLTLAARQHINVADNEFSGDLADVRISHLLEQSEDSNWGGGINLCWNHLNSNDEQVLAEMAEYHVAGADFVGCLDRERVPLGPDVSGSWFDPDRSGEGAAVQLLPDGGSLHYTFGFDNQGRQHWLIGTGPTTEYTLHWPHVGSLRGQFGQGMVEQPPWPINYPSAGTGRSWRMDRISENHFRAQRIYHDCSDCPEPIIMPLILWGLGDQLDYVRLSTIAGTRCDNRQPHQWISGAWYDPQRSGEGFLVEVLEDGSGLVYWFTYRPDDSMHQAWMIGMGEFEGQTLLIDDLIQPVGGAWGDNFDPDTIELEHWGTLSLEFHEPDNGHVFWDSVDPDYGSGDHPIERLTQVRLAECD